MKQGPTTLKPALSDQEFHSTTAVDGPGEALAPGLLAFGRCFLFLGAVRIVAADA